MTSWCPVTEVPCIGMVWDNLQVSTESCFRRSASFGNTTLGSRPRDSVAFERRCIPSRCVAHRSNAPGILSPRALRHGRVATLDAWPYLADGTLVWRSLTRNDHAVASKPGLAGAVMLRLGRPYEASTSTARWEEKG